MDSSFDDATERLLSFIRIPSISTDPAYRKDCANAANWLADQLQEIGFDSSVRPTDGHPMVMASGPINDRRVLFYGHYDVQPVDPLENWNHPPFEPFIETQGGKEIIRGRGASDDKGQLMTFVEACRAWKKVTGELPKNIIFLFEGEEESGSPSLVPFLEQNRKELASEIALICDTNLFDNNTPAVVLMLRGIVNEEITITGPSMDLHSGMYGGIAMNPIRVLSKILASLHDDQGKVTIPEFYDHIVSPPPDVVSSWQQLNGYTDNLLALIGLKHLAGESERTALEMVWSRPTCEFNGVNGGYCGEGLKTVIPSQASAKISFRLVDGQNPEHIRNQFRKHMLSLLPDDFTIEFKSHGDGKASCYSTGHPLYEIVHNSLSEEWPNSAVYTGCGGSIPIAGHFKEILNIDSVLAGFGLDEDRIHSPNEKYDLRSFKLGMRSWARVLNTFT